MDCSVDYFLSFFRNGDFLHSGVERWISQKRLREPACVFLRDYDVLALREFSLYGLEKELVVVGTDNRFFDVYAEGTEVFDKAFGCTESADGCRRKRDFGRIVC